MPPSSVRMSLMFCSFAISPWPRCAAYFACVNEKILRLSTPYTLFDSTRWVRPTLATVALAAIGNIN